MAVITAAGAAGPVGFTATSLSSVAAEPPLVSFGVGTSSSSWPAVSETEYVGVHILGEAQHDLAATFARTGADRFGPATDWRSGPEGVPLLGGVVAWLVGRVVARVPAGDHRIVIAEVVAGDPSEGGQAAGLPPRPFHGSARLRASGAVPEVTSLATSQFQALAYG